MPKMNISRSQYIDRSPSQLHTILADMSQWPAWSPWLITDPDTDVSVSPDKKHYAWEGRRTGEGEMLITSESQGKIEYDLVFLKPWKSRAKVAMLLDSEGDGTRVTWLMDSKLPFFMFFMKKMMEAFIGNDYDRGLRLLKDYAEDGEVHSKLHFVGHEDYPGCDYLGLSRSCTLDESPQYMKEDFTRLMQYAYSTEGMRPQESFCIYHKWDMVLGKVQYTAGVPYTQLPVDILAGAEQGNLPSTKVYTLEHKGPYEHLGNAWSTLYAMQRSKEILPVKAIHPFETYGNSPADTDPKDLITRLHFAVKY